MTFYVIDKRTGKEPIFDGNHIFREAWCKGRLIERDIDGWYISEDGQLALVDDCCNMAYPPPDRFKIVYDEPTVCEIEQIKTKIITMSYRYSLARERGCNGQVEWSDRLIKVDDVLKVFEEYQKGGK